MSFLPDITADGKLKEEPKAPTLYTPPTKRVHPGVWNTLEVPHDTKGKKLKVLDAPVMDDMHECVPNEAHECSTCGRDMIV